MTGSIVDGEDVVQDALFQVHRKLETFDDTRPLAPWLFRLRTIAALIFCGGAEFGRTRRKAPRHRTRWRRLILRDPRSAVPSNASCPSRHRWNGVRAAEGCI